MKNVIHVYPVEDWIEHRVDGWPDVECPCEPTIEFKDPNTGEEHNGVLVKHNSVSKEHPET